MTLDRQLVTRCRPRLPRPADGAGTGRPWRVLADDGGRDPRRNLALDEALARAAGPDPTLRLWRNDPCVVVGRSQVAEAEVDIAACRELEIPVLRRFSGGGTVYHDPGNLNVSLILRRDDPVLANRPELARAPGIYRLLLEPLARAVACLGLPAEATERDLLVDGAKVSGVAAWIGGQAILVHGTLLVDADLEVLDRVLDGPGAPGDPRWERTKSRRATVTSLARALSARAGRGAGDALAASIDTTVVTAFAGEAGRADHPTAEETANAHRLMATRYGQPGWHLGGLPPWRAANAPAGTS